MSYSDHPMSFTPEFLPDVGVYQSFRYDSIVQLGAVTTIAHARAIEYFTEEGVDHNFIQPRETFGFTLSSRRDVHTAADQLLRDRFDITTFAEDVAAIPPVTDGPMRLANVFCTDRYAGIRLRPEDRGELAYRLAMVRFAADNRGGRALPVRQKFNHVTLLFHAARRQNTQLLTSRYRVKIREIIAAAQEEVGLREIYLGKLMVGYDIGKPLLY